MSPEYIKAAPWILICLACWLHLVRLNLRALRQQRERQRDEMFDAAFEEELDRIRSREEGIPEIYINLK